MKYLALLLGLSSILGHVLADAPIVNADAKDGVVADQYIVVYQDNANLHNRKKHEDDVNSRAKGKKKAGINQVFNITGFNGYSIEIAPEDLPLITKDSMVCNSPRQAGLAGKKSCTF
jgi:hypothetical protein